MNCKELFDYLKEEYEIEDPDFYEHLADFIIDNEWFGVHPTVILETNDIEIKDEEAFGFIEKLEPYLESYNDDLDLKIEKLLGKLENLFPETHLIFMDFLKSSNRNNRNFSEESIYHLLNFIVTRFVDEVTKLSDRDAQHLMEDAIKALSVTNCNMLSMFLADTKKKYRTFYVGDYFLEKEKMKNNDAYELDDYCNIMYHMFNEDYIHENGMYNKACNSKDYINIWLFISLHFICALRSTDLIRLPHPDLPYEPLEVLSRIKNGMFTKEESVKVLYSVIWYLEYTQAKPNKTAKYNVDSIKFFVPKSVEEHIGKLFAIAESWYRLEKCEGPLIKQVTDYKTINKVMGEEIGNLFLESNFHSRKANKSYMQIIEVLTDSVIGMNEDFHVKGYMLASLARSHKGSYGAFANTTIKYLKDQKMTGYSPEFVAKELFERGVLSYIPKMLLSMITDREFDKLDIHTQTNMIQELGLTPFEVESMIDFNEVAMNEANNIVSTIYASDNRQETITEIVHRIGNGEAVSKKNNIMCLLTAIERRCPFDDCANCSVCPYEISTKYTLMNMVHESKRLKQCYKEATTDLEKGKYKDLLLLVAKSIDDMIECYKEMYGEEDTVMFKNILRSLNEKN